MHKKKKCFLICLSILLPTLLFAGALERYTVQQQTGYSVQRKATVSERVYDDFRKKIRNYTNDQKIKMREYYRNKMKQAVGERNLDAASYYNQLIEILNSEIR